MPVYENILTYVRSHDFLILSLKILGGYKSVFITLIPIFAMLLL